jgi:dTDP-4-amino-4,6-dideoxygalactose transaminase
VFHVYVVRVSERDGLMERLKQAGIGSAIHYPIPLHLQKAYTAMGYGAGAFAVTERAAGEIVSLPMYPQLTAAQQARVAAQVRAFLAERAKAELATESV